jgi:hypothetical protein
VGRLRPQELTHGAFERQAPGMHSVLRGPGV